MSQPITERVADAPRDRRTGFLITAGCFIVVALVLLLTPGALPRSLPQAQFQFDLSPLLAQSALVQFHVATVLIALALGPVQFVLPKGNGLHRVLGWTWAVAMFATALATFFIRDMRDGQFSPIHIFSLMAFVGVPFALWLARVKAMSHARAMVGLYIGLVIAGLTAIAPGRVVWDMLFR
jgi:uncharacterized membrane protein